MIFIHDHICEWCFMDKEVLHEHCIVCGTTNLCKECRFHHDCGKIIKDDGEFETMRV